MTRRARFAGSSPPGGAVSRLLASGTTIFFLTIAAGAARGQGVPDGTLAHGSLSFDANATLGAFTGVTRELSGALRGAPRLDAVRGWVEARTATLTTNNGHRDRDMATSLDIPHYPVMRFDLDSITPGRTDGDSTAVTLHGRFTIHGTAKLADIPGWIRVAADSARFHGGVPMDVKDYGVGHLSKALGVLKMNEHITVHVDVMFALRH